MTTSFSAWRWSLSYILVAGLWVLFSDGQLIALGLSAEQMERAQLIKGLAFVALTGICLYAILTIHSRQHQRAQYALQRSEKRLYQALEASQNGMWD